MFVGGVPQCRCLDGTNGLFCGIPVDINGNCIEGWELCYNNTVCCEKPNCQTTTLFSPGYKLVSDGPVNFLNLTFPTHLVSQDCTKAFGRMPGTNNIAIYNVVDGSPLVNFNGWTGDFLTIYNDGTDNHLYQKTNTVPNNYASLILTDLGQLVVYNLSNTAVRNPRRSLLVTQMENPSPLGELTSEFIQNFRAINTRKFIEILGGQVLVSATGVSVVLPQGMLSQLPSTFLFTAPPIRNCQTTTSIFSDGGSQTFVMTWQYLPPVIYNTVSYGAKIGIFGQNFGNNSACLRVSLVENENTVSCRSSKFQKNSNFVQFPVIFNNDTYIFADASGAKMRGVSWYFAVTHVTYKQIDGLIGDHVLIKVTLYKGSGFANVTLGVFNDLPSLLGSFYYHIMMTSYVVIFWQCSKNEIAHIL